MALARCLLGALKSSSWFYFPFFSRDTPVFTQVKWPVLPPPTLIVHAATVFERAAVTPAVGGKCVFSGPFETSRVF